MAKRPDTADKDFERIAHHEIGRMATQEWDGMTYFWRMLQRTRPSTRRRLLCHCLQVCSNRGDAPPAKLVAYLCREIERPSRRRVHEPEKLRAAAHYLADHPGCSLSEIAKAIGMREKNKTTVREYMGQPEFWRECNDHLVRLRRKGGTEAELRERLVQTKI